jgi:hypothetical protein
MGGEFLSDHFLERLRAVLGVPPQRALPLVVPVPRGSPLVPVLGIRRRDRHRQQEAGGRSKDSRPHFPLSKGTLLSLYSI